MTARRSFRFLATDRPVDGLVLFGLLILAAALRLPNLDARGPFDADQGRTMLALEGWLRRGAVPLLGPPASIGNLHHGALFFYLLAPAAAFGGLHPTPVVAVLAAAGVATVGLVWSLARVVGGRIAGLTAGLLFAVSAAEVGRSTSLWNPGLVPFGSALAAAAGWQAWRSERPGWWLVAGVGAAIALQSHFLSAVAVAPLATLAVADLRRSPGRRRRVAVGALGGVAMVALSYLPLLVHELGSGFAETRALAAAVATGEAGERSPWTLFVVAIRVASASLVGLVTTAPELAIVVGLLVAAGTLWLAFGERDGGSAEGGSDGPRERRLAVRWLGGTVLVVVLSLWLVAPGLATVVEALPVDHYHAASDPLVVALAGIVAGSLVELGRRRGSPSLPVAGRTVASGARALAVTAPLLAVLGLGVWNLSRQPAAVAPDGGWPAVEGAARRVATSLPTGSMVLLRSLPSFTTPDAMTFALHAVGRPAIGPEEPLGADGRAPRPTEPPAPRPGIALVVLCDDRFRGPLGAPCDGPAEATWLGPAAWTLVDRFALSGERHLSVYLPAALSEGAPIPKAAP